VPKALQRPALATVELVCGSGWLPASSGLTSGWLIVSGASAPRLGAAG
jgi:hypothetical protein|tara:strand:- start:322 stop:465 length:144 start_codon:yes stop_codon:yes gene_type:complete